MLIRESALPRIEENEIWAVHAGIQIENTGSDPLIRANRIHDAEECGIEVYDGASPRIDDNEIWSTGTGIEIRYAGTNPLIRAKTGFTTDRGTAFS